MVETRRRSSVGRRRSVYIDSDEERKQQQEQQQSPTGQTKPKFDRDNLPVRRSKRKSAMHAEHAVTFADEQLEISKDENFLHELVDSNLPEELRLQRLLELIVDSECLNLEMTSKGQPVEKIFKEVARRFISAQEKSTNAMLESGDRIKKKSRKDSLEPNPVNVENRKIEARLLKRLEVLEKEEADWNHLIQKYGTCDQTEANDTTKINPLEYLSASDAAFLNEGVNYSLETQFKEARTAIFGHMETLRKTAVAAKLSLDEHDKTHKRLCDTIREISSAPYQTNLDSKYLINSILAQ